LRVGTTSAWSLTARSDRAIGCR